MPVFYARGGAMMMRAAVSAKGDGNTLLFVDSSAFYPLALEDKLLKVSGARLEDFRPEPGAPPSPGVWKREGPLKSPSSSSQNPLQQGTSTPSQQPQQ